jgi:hypothetical protein
MLYRLLLPIPPLLACSTTQGCNRPSTIGDGAEHIALLAAQYERARLLILCGSFLASLFQALHLRIQNALLGGLIGTGELLKEGMFGGSLSRIIINDEEFSRKGVSIGGPKGLKFCWHFLAKRRICDSCSASVCGFLNRESNQPFTIALGVPTILCDVREESRRDLMAADKGVDLSLTFNILYRDGHPFIVDNNLLEAKVVFADIERHAYRPELR